MKTKTFARNRVALLAALIAPIATQAATYTWTGAGFFGNQDYLWSNPNNWAELAAPQPGEQGVSLIFPNAAVPKNTTNDVLNLVLSSVAFQGANYSIHGSPSGITMTLAGANGGSYVLLATASNCQFGDGTRLHFGSAGTIAVANGTTLTLKSRLSGTFGFTKLSPGTLRLQSLIANTFSGPATVEDGTLDLSSRTAAPVTPLVSIPGALIIGGTNGSLAPLVRLLADDQIADPTAVTVNENGRLWLNGNSDVVGTITLRDGAAINTGIGSGSTAPGVLTLNGNLTNLSSSFGSMAAISGRLDLGVFTRTMQVEGWLRIYASISGGSIFNPGITKTGFGSLQFTGGTNSYTGPTHVHQGMLHLYAGTSLLGSTNAGTTVSAGAELYLEGVSIFGEALELNGSNDNAPLRFRGTNHWGGTVTLNGLCEVNNPGWPGDPLADLNISGVVTGSGGLRKTGDGCLHLTGFGGNTFTGGLYCETGWTLLNKSASAPALAGPLFIGKAGEQGQWTFVQVLQLNQIPNDVPVTLRDFGSLSAENGATDTLGHLELAGGWLVGLDGEFTLGGNVTNRLSTNNIGAIYGTTTLTSGAHIFACEDFSQLEVHGALQGSGAITKTGTGGLTFFNANSYSGLTWVQEGGLRLEGKGRPGSAAAGTVVEGLARLSLWGVNVTNEALTLQPVSIYSPKISVANTNLWKGPLVLNTTARIETFFGPQLTIDGPISGPGGIDYLGDSSHLQDGTLVLAGSTDNTFAGDVNVVAGTLLLAKSSTIAAIPGNVIVGLPTNGAPAALVRCDSPYQFTIPGASSRTVTVNPSGHLDCNNWYQTIAGLQLRDGLVSVGTGKLALRENVVVTSAANGASYLFGDLVLLPGSSASHTFDIQGNAGFWLAANIEEGGGTAHLIKTGSGSLALIGNSSFSGTTTISNGIVLASGSQPLGTVNSPTLVESGATLIPFAATLAEPLVLSGPGYTNGGALRVTGTNTLTGPIQLALDSIVFCAGEFSQLTLSGVISGGGGLSKTGAGKLTLAGPSANTYLGLTLVDEGVLELSKTNALAIAGPLTVANPAAAHGVLWLQPEQINDASTVQINGGLNWLHLNGFAETISALEGDGLVFQGLAQTGLLTIGANNSSATFAGAISGGGGLTKIGTGTVTLNGNHAYTGPTTVSSGKLVVNGQQPQSSVAILTGGVLGGSGRVGPLGDLNGHVAPGGSPGILKCSNFTTFSPANQLQIEIGGVTPGGGHDQLQVNGTVLLMGGTVQVAMNFPGAINNHYVIISNDGADAVTGTFTGLPSGAMLTNNGVVFQITYTGGDGNDVALIQQTAPGAATITGGQMLGNGFFQIDGSGQPNTTYTVEATPNLHAPIEWTELDEVTTDGAGLMQFIDLDAHLFPMRFYRFRQP